MPQVYAIDGIIPVIHPSSFIHPTAVIMGDVIIGEGCYIGPTACLRGDFGRLIIGKGCNVQDTCVMHGFPGTDTVIEDEGHIGHGAVLHGCHVGRNAMVGMNAVVMDGARIGEESLVAAMAFVKAGMEIPARSLVAGVPAKIIRTVSDDEINWKSKGTATYQALARRCFETMEQVEALTEVDPNRPRIEIADVMPLYQRKMNQK